MQIDESDEQPEKAALSIRMSFEPRSNMTFRRVWHRLKQSMGRDSTQKGMQIDESD
jgi:hypothetical protein